MEVVEGFAGCARDALVLAHREAKALGHRVFDADHMLLGLIQAPTCRPALARCGSAMTIEQLRERLHARHGRTAGSGDDLAFTEAARGVLALALRLAQKLGADEIEATHLMLGYAKAHKKRAPSSQSLLDAHYWDLRSALGYSTVVPERKDDGGTAPLDRAWTYLAVLQLAEQSRRVMVRVLLQGDMDLSPKASDIAKQVRVLAGNLGRRLKL